MVNLEQIAQTGMVSVDATGVMHPEMISLAEQLMAEEFAEAINSGRLSVKDAYRNFWSYEEDRKLWGLDENREWRALLPAWDSILESIVPMLEIRRAEEVIDILSEGYFKAAESLAEGRYNPLFDDIDLCTRLVSDIPSYQDQLFEKVKDILDSTRVESVKTKSIKYIGNIGSDTAIAYLLDLLDNHVDGQDTFTIEKAITDSPYSDRFQESIFYERIIKKCKTSNAENNFQSIISRLHKLRRTQSYNCPGELINFTMPIVIKPSDTHYISEAELLNGSTTLRAIYSNIISKGEDVQHIPVLKRLVEQFPHEVIPYENLNMVHNNLKPRGYNPSEKRLNSKTVINSPINLLFGGGISSKEDMN